MRTVVLTTLVVLLLLPFAAGAQPSVQTCITLYGNSALDVDCTKLAPAPWTPVGAPGQILLFKNIWGKGKKDAKTGVYTGPKTASVSLAGPLCWSGDPPTLTLMPTTPTGGGAHWTALDLYDWQAVKLGGACQLCCYITTSP